MKEKLKNIINNFYNKYINSLSVDQVLHSYISTCLFIIIYALFNIFINIWWVSIILSFIIVNGIGIFKEKIIDEYIRGGKSEFKDIKSNFIGSIIGVILMIINKYI